MPEEMVVADVSKVSAVVQVTPALTEHGVSFSDGELQLIRALPAHAVRDFLSIGVCVRCIFRLLGIQGHISCCSTISPSVLWSMLVENQDSSAPLECKESEICRVCLGILQFTYCDDKKVLVRKDNANNFASTIAELVKQGGYQMDSFSLELSVPPVILENERIIWSHMKEKYGSEPWFEERSIERVSAKDAIKCEIINLLETVLGVKSVQNVFRIRLTYSKPSDTESSAEMNPACKKRKTETANDLKTSNHEQGTTGTSSDSGISNGNEFVERSDGLKDLESSKCLKSPLKEVFNPCHLMFDFHMPPLYFGGRYLKYSRNVSQTRWIIGEERMGEASVEEIIGGNILPLCGGDNYKFHGAGREDIDVRMLGSGRPFLVEVQNPRIIPSEVLVKEIEAKINNLKPKLVGVKNLKLVGSHGWTLMREGEAEKQKQYVALVWISRPIEDKDLQLISSHKDLKTLQRTPVRVLHRRSPLDREKIIHWMKIERIAGSSQYFLLHLCTQAGTYIKEFVHGDLGRTQPNIGSILKCRAEILQLDVTDVKMDCFLTE